MAAYKRFVDFHGELLLLLHWSLLAYTGLVKILKKHLKRTGLPVRAPQLENLLSQPFCSVEARSCPDAVSLPHWISLCVFEPCQTVAGLLSHITARLWCSTAYIKRMCDELHLHTAYGRCLLLHFAVLACALSRWMSATKGSPWPVQ